MIAYSMCLLLAILGAWSSAISRWASQRPLFPKIPLDRSPFGVWSALGVFGLYVILTGLMTWASGLKVDKATIGSVPPDKLLLLTTAVNAVMLVAVPLFLRMTSGARLKDIGVPGPDPVGNVGRGIWLILLVWPAVILIGALASRIWPIDPESTHPLEKLVTEHFTATSFLIAAVSGIIFAPLAEELMFRGVFLPALARPFLRPNPEEPAGEGSTPVAPPLDETAPPLLSDDPFSHPYTPPTVYPTTAHRPDGFDRATWVPNILTSLFFALMHGPQWPSPIPLFVLSMALGWARQRTGGLVAPIVMHMLFNANSTVLLAFALRGGAE